MVKCPGHCLDEKAHGSGENDVFFSACAVAGRATSHDACKAESLRNVRLTGLGAQQLHLILDVAGVSLGLDPDKTICACAIFWAGSRPGVFWPCLESVQSHWLGRDC